MLNKIYFAVLLSLLLLFSPKNFAFENSKKTDSLVARLNVSGIEEKIKAYTDLINYYRTIQPLQAIVYCEKALQISRADKYAKGEADILYLLGVCYHSQSNYPKALECYQLSLDIHQKLKNNVGIGLCLNRIGLIQNVLGDYEKALKFCLQSVGILEGEKDKKALGESYNHLGILYYILNDIPKAKEISLKALKFCENINEDLVLAVSHEHLGVIYIKTKEYDKALYHVEKSLKLRLPKNDRLGVAGSYDNLAIIYRNLKKYENALTYYNKSIQLKTELGNNRGIASSISGLGKTYFLMGQYQKSLDYTKQSFEVRKQLKDMRGMVASLNQLADTYSAMEDYKKALEAHKLSNVYSDSLMSEQKNKAIAEYQEAFQQERRDKEIQLLQKENTIHKNMWNYLLIIIVLLLAIATSISFAYRSKRKVNILLTNHNEEVTKQREELLLLNEQLQELVATKDKFFSIIAHDLKSPFQGLLGYSQILSSEYNTLSEEEKKSFINGIEELSRSSYNLLENLLEWSRIQTGQMIYNPENFNLLVELYPTLSLVKQTAENKKIEFTYSVDNSIFINADKNMLSTIVRNLVSNSIKFTNQGGRIQLLVKKLDDCIEFSITDSGVGIEKKHLDNLFKIEKGIVRKGTANEEGTGLGLLLCKEMVEKHNGVIWVESEVGTGSTFSFTIKS